MKIATADVFNKPLFQVKTPLGFPVRTTAGYWKVITTVKHPSMAKKQNEVKECLFSPDEIRRSKRDKNVYLFYHRLQSRYLCVVIKHERKQSFVVTTYVTDKIKEGEIIWKK